MKTFGGSSVLRPFEIRPEYALEREARMSQSMEMGKNLSEYSKVFEWSAQSVKALCFKELHPVGQVQSRSVASACTRIGTVILIVDVLRGLCAGRCV